MIKKISLYHEMSGRMQIPFTRNAQRAYNRVIQVVNKKAFAITNWRHFKTTEKCHFKLFHIIGQRGLRKFFRSSAQWREPITIVDRICHRWKSFETNLLGRHHFEHIRHSLIVAVHWSIVYRKVVNFLNFIMTCFFFPRTYDYREPMNLERKLKSFLSTIMFHRTFNHSLFSVSSFKMFYLIKQEFLKK